jgi:DNA repair exonuclease SbcCD ATPase subunit
MPLAKKELLLLAKQSGVKNVSKLTKSQLLEVLNNKTDYEYLKKSNNTPVKYIYHTADLHIRPLDRHEEYNIVFNNLFDILRTKDELENSVFVICGDIFHARDRLLSETLILFNNFIEKLTSIIDVVCILGNHDTFTHINRLDTLSGISDIKTFNNFYFLKKSGIYVYKNIYFTVSSILDNHFISSDFKTNEPMCIKVALYHGCVSGSKINEFYNVPESIDNIKVSDFKGFDIVLLGDIHKRQLLTDNIAYSGSLIQQNHSEDTVKGILKWDTKTLISEFIHVYNPYQFITISRSNYKLIKYPIFSRIRHFMDYKEEENQDSQTELLDFLNKKTKVISYIKEIKPKKISNTVLENNTIINSSSKDELVSFYFNKILKDQTDNEILINEIKDLHNNFLKEVGDTNNKINSTFWSLNSLEFKNVFSYGNDVINIISFKENEIIGVLGNNAIGKTSILNTIIYCLFGNNYKGVNTSSRNIINKNSKSFYIKLIINKEPNDIFTIIREGKNKARKGGIKGMDENIRIFLNDSEITESTKNMTIQKIQDILCCNKDTFLLTNLMSYTMNSSLLNMSSSDISNIFNILFDTMYIKDIYNIVLKKYKQYISDVKIKSSELQSLKEYLLDENKVQQQLKENKEKIKEIEKMLCDTNKNIESILEKTIYDHKIIYTKTQYENALKFIKSQEGQELELNSSKDILRYHMKNLEKYINKDFLICEKTEEKVKKEISILESKYRQIDNHLEKKEYIHDNQYIKIYNDFKKTNGENINKKLFQGIIEYVEYITTEEYIKNKYSIICFEKNQKNISYNEDLKNQIEILNKQLVDIYQQRYYLYKDTLTFIQSKEVVDNYTEYNLIKEFLKIKEELYFKKTEYTKQMSILIKYQGVLETKIEANKKYIVKINKLEVELETIQRQLSIYEIYKNIMNPKALPKLLLIDTIKKVELFCNTFIYNQIGLYVNLNTIEDDDSKWEITFQRGDIILGSEHLSGFEKFIVNLGLKTALDKYKFYNNGKIFFIDEVFDCISEENWEKIPFILNYIKSHYSTLMLISHNEKLKVNVNRVLKFEKMNFNITRIKM